MVTIVYDRNGRPTVFCKSTDEKPLNMPNGTPCMEIDTWKVSIFDEEDKTYLPAP